MLAARPLAAGLRPQGGNDKAVMPAARPSAAGLRPQGGNDKAVMPAARPSAAGLRPQGGNDKGGDAGGAIGCRTTPAGRTWGRFASLLGRARTLPPTPPRRARWPPGQMSADR